MTKETSKAGKTSKTIINIEKITTHKEAILAYLRKDGYSQTAIQTYKMVIKKLATYAENHPDATYEDFINDFSKVFGIYNEGYLRRVRGITARLEQYDKYTILPIRGKVVRLGDSHDPRTLPRRYRRYITISEQILKKRMIAKSTQTVYTQMITNFLLYLTNEGADHLHKVTEEMVLGYFYQDNKQIRGRSSADCLRTFFTDIPPLYPLWLRQAYQQLDARHPEGQTPIPHAHRRRGEAPQGRHLQ